MATRATATGNICSSSMLFKMNCLRANFRRAKAYAAVVLMATISSAEMDAILMLFHSHSSTGKGGCTTVPSACVTGMPSASCQCSKLMAEGISEPVAKLPGRRLMLTTASNGNSVKASSTHRLAWAAKMRQRWLLPVTIIVQASRCAG